MRYLILLAVLLLAGCKGTTGPTKPSLGTRIQNAICPVPKGPETVTVTVTERAPIPEWAKEALPTPVRANDTVGAHLDNENALENVVKRYACDRALLRRIDKGETVNPDECKQ